MSEEGENKAFINGEKEKKKENTVFSNESYDNEFDVIARFRVGNTINSLNQGMS